MHKENYNVVGVMSGTSLDGIDLAHIRLDIASGTWKFELLECETIPYSATWKSQLAEAVSIPSELLPALDESYTKLLSNIINQFITKHQLNVDAVCSHGHTVLHQPHRGVTLQIGNLPAIATLTNQLVVCDFRKQDVALGGQGAPLVPIGDRLLFAEFDYCLNLGGFSNVSFEQANNRIAFDISPVNTVLNYLSQQIGHDYDDGGAIAKSGVIDDSLLSALNALPFYKMPFPKSLGVEFVYASILPLIEKSGCSINDKMRTFTEHIAQQTALALKHPTGKLLVTGGGAYNHFLIERMRHHLPKVVFEVPPKLLLEYKEALIFALLGVLKLRGEINVLSSVTGAPRDHCSGIIYR